MKASLTNPGARHALPVAALFLVGFVAPLIAVVVFSFMPARSFSIWQATTLELKFYTSAPSPSAKELSGQTTSRSQGLWKSLLSSMESEEIWIIPVKPTRDLRT